MSYFYIPFVLTIILYSYIFITNALHLYQLQSYNILKTIHTYKARLKMGDVFLYLISMFLFYFFYLITDSFIFKTIVISIFNLLFFIYILNFIGDKSDGAKLPLKYTKRIIRFLIIYLLLFAVLLFLCCYYIKEGINVNSLFYFLPIISYVMFILTHLLCCPIEKCVYLYYLAKAKRRLNLRKDIVKIGITGSYGKTSTKFILATILKEKYSVLTTPNSFNTPMGISKTILHDLKPNHQVFIMEMGANKVGDIKYLCKCFKPNVGVLTNIGKAHLEGFKTFNNIVKTKCELPENLFEPKLMVFNCDNKYINDYAIKYKNKKISIGSNNDLYAKIVKVNEFGSEFIVYYKQQQYLTANTKLLGEHNINNILLAIGVAIELGLSKQQIISGIKKIESVKNRLELIKNKNGLIILNDSYNSNPAGCKVALKVLNDFNEKQKIVITPGMVELGKDQYRENYKFGKEIARVANKVFVVNKVNKDALINGLFDGGFDFEYVKTVNKFQQIDFRNFDKNCVVLIENDLPDNYE